VRQFTRDVLGRKAQRRLRSPTRRIQITLELERGHKQRNLRFLQQAVAPHTLTKQSKPLVLAYRSAASNRKPSEWRTSNLAWRMLLSFEFGFPKMTGPVVYGHVSTR
jgi:hypothetical protein